VSTEPSEDLRALDATLTSIEKVVDVAALRAELAALTALASAPDLWDDSDRGQAVTSRMSTLTGEIERIEGLRQRLSDAEVLLELARAEDDPASLAEAVAEIAGLTRPIAELEVRTLLAGEYDEREALIIINPGAGGVDSQDWAEMLLRMYLRWGERRGHPLDVLDVQYAEEAGIKSATARVAMRYAYGTLSGEHGVHRLVRISPFDNQSRRQTSFAAVDVTPVVEASDHVEIDDKDVRVDVFRSSGPGGQGVNTTDSAVRLTHLPTGIVVSCQNERSQIQNRAAAMLVLQAKLLERRRVEAVAEMDKIRGGRQDIAFGSQIRNYVLHPYQMVKDLRTEVETGNTGAVLDGEIDEFIEAEIRWRRGQDADAERS
jgi:peptide chain release factor 2